MTCDLCFFQLMGLVVLGFSIFGLVDGRGVAKLVEEGSEVMGSSITIDLYNSASVVLIVFSSLIVLISFLGCCGAWKVLMNSIYIEVARFKIFSLPWFDAC